MGWQGEKKAAQKMKFWQHFGLLHKRNEKEERDVVSPFMWPSLAKDERKGRMLLFGVAGCFFSKGQQPRTASRLPTGMHALHRLTDTGHQYLEENSQLLAKREQVVTIAPSEEQGLCHWLLIPRAKHLFLKQQLLHPSLKLANPAFDPGRENSAVH